MIEFVSPGIPPTYFLHFSRWSFPYPGVDTFKYPGFHWSRLLSVTNTLVYSSIIVFVYFVHLPIFVSIPLAVGFGVGLMILLNVTHPPAGGNPIIVIIGSV